LKRDETLKMGLLKALKTGIRKEKTQEIFSVVVSIGVYVRGQLFEWRHPQVLQCQD